jgi:PilZ domain-containing protein
MADETNALGAVEDSHRERFMVALLKMPAYLNSADPWSERRMFPRKEVHAQVQSHRLDHTIQARQDPRVSLALRDLSLGGLSAISERPLNRGEHLSVVFPPQGTLRGWDAFGRVIRCDPSGMGYRIAVEFDALPAA